MATNKDIVAVNDFKNENELLEAIDKTIRSFKDGDVITGEVVKVDHDEVLVDVQYKTEGVIPAKELSVQNKVKPEDFVKVGDKIDALVIQKEDREGRLILSKKRAIYEKAWSELIKAHQEGTVVQGTVFEVVNKGVKADVGIPGFVPASHIDLRRGRDRALDSYLGQTMDFKILEIDKSKNNVVLSHKAIIEDETKGKREEFMAGLEIGQIRKGIVTSVPHFGAFIDLGGFDGLVHVSEISWNHIEHPSEVVKIGDEVTVEVKEIEKDPKGEDRISLSIKATQEDPWQVFARSHAIGQVVPGKIVKIVNFGAFIKVAEGIEGLVHISELSSKHISSADQIAAVGDEMFAKIVDIDLERRRISLSIKQATDLVKENPDFDPSLYGAATDLDENGNYAYPEGFDPEKNEWKKGFEEQKAEWEANYLAAKNLYEKHLKFIKDLEAKEDAVVEVEVPKAEPKKRTRTKATESEVEELSNNLGSNADLEALKESLA